MENKGTAVSRDLIMTRLWETDSFVDDNTLTVNVTRLRRKLEEAGLSGFIVTKKELGIWWRRERYDCSVSQEEQEAPGSGNALLRHFRGGLLFI